MWVNAESKSLSSPLVIGVEGLNLKKEDQLRLRKSVVGGVILFSRNYESVSQLKALTAEIKNINPDLVIMADQEGGRVMRFRTGFSAIPSAKTFGDLMLSQGIEKACSEAQEIGHLMASELLACDVDLSLSPVVDLGINQEIIGTRAFHTDPEKVILLAKAWITGMNQAGMKSVLKHFPGHGSVKGDTHISYLKDDREFSLIAETDLVPFQSLSEIAEGVMASHVIYPHIDSLPASFSPIWLKDILREKIGFKGIILSDDLGMQAAKLSEKSEKFDEPIRLALSAGSDAVLLCNEFKLIDRVLASEDLMHWLSCLEVLSLKKLLKNY